MRTIINKGIMKTKKEVYEFLDSLQWERVTKKELSQKLSDFFGTEMILVEGTCQDCKEVDYSWLTTTADTADATHNFIDIEIYYLKMRQRNHFLITETTLLDYVE